MYFGLVCLLIGAIVIATAKSKVKQRPNTPEGHYHRVKWSIILFESNVLGLIGALCIKCVAMQAGATLLALLLVAVTVIAMLPGAGLINDINEGLFMTYRYFPLEVAKSFNATTIIAAFVWLAIYYLYWGGEK